MKNIILNCFTELDQHRSSTEDSSNSTQKKYPIEQGHFVGQRSNQINNDIRDLTETTTYMKGKEGKRKLKEKKKDRNRIERHTLYSDSALIGIRKNKLIEKIFC